MPTPCPQHGRAAPFWMLGALLYLAAGALSAQPTPLALPAAPAGAAAASTPPATSTTLAQAIEAALQRLPEAAAADLRRESARASKRLAQSWTPEPASIEASTRTDRLTRNDGARELEVGVAVPLWLPGERQRTEALADVELLAVDSRLAAARWRMAGQVRDAWWALQLAQQDVLAARDRVDSAVALAADVARRLRAGDLARADQNQAEAAAAAAQAEWSNSVAARAQAAAALRALTGTDAPAGGSAEVAAAGEDTPAPEQQLTPDHPALRELSDKVSSLSRTVELARVQTRGNPELTLLTTRDRGAAGERFGQTVSLGIRIPLGSNDRSRARAAAAAGDLAEAQAGLRAAQERVLAEAQSSRARLDASRALLAAAERRAQLALQTRGFIDKAFRLGETDLPTRLRVEAEASEAQRQSARARIQVAAAVSAWRQALGLLPP